MPERKLFVLEDNRPLSDGIVRLCRRLGGWNVEVARSINDAKAACKGGSFDAVLIDLMVPASTADLGHVDTWLNERDGISHELVTLQLGSGNETQTSTQARREEILQRMQKLDSLIRGKVKENGGLEFLQTMEADNLKKPAVHFAVFSALSPHGYKRDGDDNFTAVAKAIEPNTIEKWFKKPVSLADVKAWLHSVAASLVE